MAQCWSQGGRGNGATLASAELYNPATDSWSAVGALTGARVGHTATLLPSGKVLVAGGGYGEFNAEVFYGATFFFGSILASAELYDPAANSWSAAGALTNARIWHTATLLPNGNVLVTGGGTGGAGITSSIASTELYEPATNSWSTTGALAAGRFHHTATLLPNGTVLVTGGYGTVLVGNGTVYRGALASAELYDPTPNSWRLTAALTIGRFQHTATLLSNGKVLLAGGSGDHGALAQSEAYGPATISWRAAGALSITRFAHTATLLPSGKVLVAGGNEGFDADLTGTELYDPASNRWSAAGALTGGRSGHTATLLSNGKVLVVGGHDGSLRFRTNAELYDPATNSWSTLDGGITERAGHTATLLPNGTVLVAGGFDRSHIDLISAELYDPATNRWSRAGVLTTAGSRHTATLLPNGKVLIAGGYGNSDDRNGAELYDPANNSWRATGAMITARDGHRATLMPNGKVLVVGGSKSYADYLASAELYDPASNSWSAAGAMSAARAGHSATLLPNGTVLVAGGRENGTPLASAELYDPTAESSISCTPTASPGAISGASGSQTGCKMVIEFYNTTLDHYFLTADAGEALSIDTGSAGPGWSRTGNNFKAGGTTPVCRFYGSQLPGPNSHFYTAFADECAGLKQLQARTPATQKRWNFESLDFFSTVPLAAPTGNQLTCPSGYAPVYRAYNNGFARGVDSNHRLSTSLTAIQEVVARGWINEGVVMCAPL